jgi:imidazolonepropionase-like amidohydrolase
LLRTEENPMNMKRFFYLLVIALPILFGFSRNYSQPINLPNTALVNGQWFNGRSFDAVTVYSVDGKFTFKKPTRIDTTIDLSGTWIVPPFAEAHNHNIGTGVLEWDKKAIHEYLAAGVFYVMIMGNLPVNNSTKEVMGIDQYNSVDALFAQGNITGSGGHPIGLVERILLPHGYFPGYTAQTLKDYRYFTVDSEEELDRKWPLILSHHPDFIKTMLWYSDEYEKRKDDSAYFGQRGLDPRLLPTFVAKAHAAGLREATHVTTAADFHVAVESGVDVIAHIPFLDVKSISEEDALLAAKRGIVVETTCALVSRMPPKLLPKSRLTRVLKAQLEDLKLLIKYGVTIAIGSDNVDDTSLKEVQYLAGLGIFDNLSLLKMWTETTPKVIFSNRKIGKLKEGYEASFLALDGNPLKDFRCVRKIKVRFKQGVMIEL